MVPIEPQNIGPKLSESLINNPLQVNRPVPRDDREEPATTGPIRGRGCTGYNVGIDATWTGQVHPDISDASARYRETLTPAHRMLLARFELKDAAFKVVGVGSVGTACAVLLFMAGGEEPLILQVKEARASVLEAYAGKSVFANHGQRVVNGHRLMQPASDIFLGWTEGRRGRHFYVRQLRDIKIKPAVETFGTAEMTLFAQWCGHSLALSHARSGDLAVISGYLGKSDAFDKAIAAFSVAYADQNEKDHAALKRAIQDGKIEAVIEEPK